MDDNKTLADVQPGGRVRLGDGREPMLESMWVEIRREGDRTFPRVMTKDQADAFLRTCNVGPLPTVRPLYAALSAQPSPGGQDALKALDDLAAFCSDDTETVERHVAVIRAALAARQPVYEGHTWISDYVLAGLRERAALPLQLRNGEVWHWQGDGHDFPDSLACPVIMSADTLRALLAASQPVGEPVSEAIEQLADDVESCVSDACGYLASDSGWDDYGIYRDDAAARYRALPDRIRALAAPPAQAVDLEQFRQPVQDWVDDAQASMEEHGDYDGVFGYAIEEGTRLLALIDSQT